MAQTSVSGLDIWDARAMSEFKRKLPGRGPHHHFTGLLLLHPTLPGDMSAFQPAPPDEVRQHIISSIFSRKAADGTLEETLISYVKVYEQEGEGEAKTRYLMLAGRCLAVSDRLRGQLEAFESRAPCDEATETNHRRPEAAELPNCRLEI